MNRKQRKAVSGWEYASEADEVADLYYDEHEDRIREEAAIEGDSQ